MTVQRFFFERHDSLHGCVTQHLIDGLADAQCRARPHGLNPIAWLIWHSARCEDVGVDADGTLYVSDSGDRGLREFAAGPAERRLPGCIGDYGHFIYPCTLS